MKSWEHKLFPMKIWREPMYNFACHGQLEAALTDAVLPVMLAWPSSIQVWLISKQLLRLKP